MPGKRVLIPIAALLLAGAAVAVSHRRPGALVLTGIVTTNDVIVSPQVGGRVSRLTVAEGDSVAAGQLIAVLEPSELQADQAFYAQSAEAMGSQVDASRAELAVSVAQDSEARASLTHAKQILDRNEGLLGSARLTTCKSAAGDHARARTIERFLSGSLGACGPRGGPRLSGLSAACAG